MKRLSLMVAAVAVVAMMVPFGAHAANDPVRMDCYGFANTDGTDPAEHMNRVCEAEATDADGNPVAVPAGMKPSILFTHANFHSSRTGGQITLEWIDAAGQTLAAWNCVAAAFSDDYDADLTSLPKCQQTQDAATDYTPGLHRVRATVTQAMNCPARGPSANRTDGGCYFHGRVYLVDASSAI